VARPLLTSAATTVIGFLPIFALTDQAGRLFEPLALTKSLAISGAVLFGTLLVPGALPAAAAAVAGAQAGAGAAGLAGGLAFGWFVRDGWSLPMDHGRWALTVPGWLFAPLFAALVGSAVWRIGRERLVNYEENPMSRGIHVAYEWAYDRIQRHKVPSPSPSPSWRSAATCSGTGWPR
jgi:Cu(I)/Ag(I) efflux system membrane protein CusA/SilA